MVAGLPDVWWFPFMPDGERQPFGLEPDVWRGSW